MSWAEMHYVFKLKKETGIIGNLRFVLLCIARWVKQGCYESVPISLNKLSEMTGLDERTVRRCRDELVKLDEIEIGDKGRGRGNFQTYVMRNIQGPLFIVDRAVKPDKSPPLKAGNRSLDGKFKSGQIDTLAQEKRAAVQPEVRIASSSDLSTFSTRDLSSASPDAKKLKPVAAEVYDQALTFLDWWIHAYPEHNAGARATVDLEHDGPFVAAMLHARPMERWQAMAVVLWTITEREDRFIFESDRSLKMLRHAGDRLDRYAVARARLIIASEDIAPTAWDDVCRHLKTKINRHSFQMWFSPLRLIEDRDGVLVLEAPNAQVVQWIQKHFADVLQDALQEVRPDAGVIFRTADHEASA